jgi:hypothetical protein
VEFSCRTLPFLVSAVLNKEPVAAKFFKMLSGIVDKEMMKFAREEAEINALVCKQAKNSIKEKMLKGRLNR